MGATTTCWGDNMPHDKWRRRLVCSLAFLSMAAPAIGAGDSFDGEYSGKRTLTKGSADDCPAEEDVSVTINGNVLTFTNSQLQNYPIGFYPEPDGTFDIEHVDLDGGTSDIHGRIVGGIINADVNNPPCEHHWQLKKK
jgi:hypothetical protein